MRFNLSIIFYVSVVNFGHFVQQRKGAFITWESLYFNFQQKWNKLCTLLQTDANEAEMKKKFQQPKYGTLFDNVFC
jgi:hypothetical protein